MNHRKTLLLPNLLLLVLACAACASALAQPRETFDFGWRFAKGDHPGAEQPAFDDTAWRALDLPHDWSIEGPYDQNAPTGGLGGYLPTGVGWYRKTFRLPETARGKITTIQFDGVYENSTVWINGHELGTQPYGYMTFAYDLTPHLNYGDREPPNIIAVRVDNSRQPNTRWYSGSGIYRHTWLRTTAPLRVPTWGICVTTPEITNDHATVHARVTVRNDDTTARTASVSLAILDTTGATVAQGAAFIAVTATTSDLGLKAKIPPATEREFSADLILPHPKLWSPDTPTLYRLRATVTDEGREGRARSPSAPLPSPGGGFGETALPLACMDSLTTAFGIRTIAYDLARGFLLNGEKLIMRGMCMHHDAGSVGAAVPDAMLRRRLLLLKEMGCNAIRASHNPMAPEFYDLCDELGLLVMAEFADEWTTHKWTLKHGYSDYFADWHERDLTAFIRQNRNHPSIVIWSAGNEIEEQRMPRGPAVLRQLVDIIHREDPTRPVTAACDNAYNDHGHAPAAFTDLLDIVGYNYVDRWGIRRELQYSADHDLFPTRKFIGTENTSAAGERGHYPFGPLAQTKNQKLGAGRTLAAPPHAPVGALYPAVTMRAESLWKFLATHDYVAGDFAWTGFDYLGESEWPRKQTSSGPLDTCGFKKDTYYFYQSIWTTTPMIHLLPHWNWPDTQKGKIIPVLAYTNANYAELFLNGRSLGVKAKEFPTQGASGGWNTYARPIVQPSTTDLHFTWDVPYEPGELRALAYDATGAIIAETTIRTAGPPATLELTADRPTIAADARDIAHITIRALDAAGTPVPLADDQVTITITGPAKLIGLDNGNPISHEAYKTTTRRLHAGMALAVVQSEKTPGPVTLTARAKNLAEATLTITTRRDAE